MLARPLTLYTYLGLSVYRTVRAEGQGGGRSSPPSYRIFVEIYSKLPRAKVFGLLLAPHPEFQTFLRPCEGGPGTTYIRWLRKDEKRKPSLRNTNSIEARQMQYYELIQP